MSDEQPHRRAGIGRAFEKVKTIWQRRSISRRSASGRSSSSRAASSLSIPPAQPEAPLQPVIPEPPVEPIPPVESVPVTVLESPRQSMDVASCTAAEPSNIGPQVLEVDDDIQDPAEEEALAKLFLPIKRNASPQSRATSQAHRYGFDFSQMGGSFYDDGPIPDRMRVEKKIRMRVRYTCHLCSSQFGRHLTCSKCEHSRCGDCQKYPEKRRRLEEPRDATAEIASSSNPQASTTITTQEESAAQ